MTTHSLPYILGNFPGTEYVDQITGGKVALLQSVKPLLPPQLALKAAIGTSMFERGATAGQLRGVRVMRGRVGGRSDRE